MIIDSFDDSKALINPSDALSEKVMNAGSKANLKTIVLTFSYKLINELYESEEIEIIDEELKIGAASGYSPVYRIKNTDIGVMLCYVGASAAVAAIEELNACTKCKNYIVFGSCGALTKIPEGKLIVPTHAYRDEGSSYHYVKASDYIEMSNANKLMKILDELDVEYVTGKTWTTDGFYRETENNRDRRIKEGCICVEMECSAIEAVCNYRGLQLYQFMYAADSLDEEWSRRILGQLEMDNRFAYFYLAKEIAQKL